MKLHIIGNPGSGKTTLARWAGAFLDVASVDLDLVVYDPTTGLPRSSTSIVTDIEAIGSKRHCITEGAYHHHQENALLDALLAPADIIVGLDYPWHICAKRIIQRHIRLTMARRNPHPGWLKLVRFLNYTWHSHELNRQSTAQRLRRYSRKTMRCAKDANIAAAQRFIEAAAQDT